MRIATFFIFTGWCLSLFGGELEDLKNKYSALESYADKGKIESYAYKSNRWVKVASGEFGTRYIKNGIFEFNWKNGFYSGKITKDHDGVLFYSSITQKGERKTLRKSLVSATGVSASAAIVVPPMLLMQNIGVHTKQEAEAACTKISADNRITVLGGIGCTDVVIDSDGFIEKTINEIDYQGKKTRTVLSYTVRKEKI